MITASTRTEEKNMNGMTRAALLAIAVSGCASVPKDVGFSEVQNAVGERTGQRVEWRAQSEAAVRTLLQDELTAERAVQIALLNSRRLQAIYEELGIARANLIQAGLLRNPVFNAEILFVENQSSEDLRFGISQDFLSIFYLPLRRQIAESEFEAAKLRVTHAVLELIGEVRSGFVRYQASQQTVEMLSQAAFTRSASFDAAKELHEAGNITDLALHQEQALFEETRIELARTEAEAARKREQLNTLMGLWGENTQWKATSRLPEIPDDTPDFVELEKRVVAANLELAAARTELGAATLGLRQAGVLVPELGIGVDYEREDREDKFGPTLRVPIPIFDFGQGRVSAARAQLRRAQENYAALAVEIRATARAAAQTLASARDRALHVKNVLLPLRNRISQETLLQYNAQQVGVFELLLAEERLLNAGRRYIETLRDYWLARGALDLALAGGRTDLRTESVEPPDPEYRLTEEGNF
jgi:cobalt-zinc-cadmium efflux system outer membrane protein